MIAPILTLATRLYPDFGYREVKLATLFERTFDPDFAAVRFDNLPCQRESQPGTTKAASHTAIDLITAMEDFVELGSLDSDSVIRNRHLYHRTCSHFNPQFDLFGLAFAAWAELDRIVEQLD